MFLVLLSLATLFYAEELSPPSLESFAPEVQKQLREAYDRLGANPEDAAAAGEVGILLHAYGEIESAILYYEKARSLQQTEFRWAYYLGVAQTEVGRHEEARLAFHAALRLKPQHLPSRLSLAESLALGGEAEKSEEIYRDILAQFPDSARAHFGLGRVQMMRGDREGAVESYETACRLYPEYGAAHYALALIYRDRNDRARARNHLNRYQQNPQSSPPLEDSYLAVLDQRRLAAVSYLEKGVGFESAGDIVEAIAEHERALELNPRLALAHVNLITLYGRLGKLEDAEEHYRAVLRVNPNFAEAHYNFGVVLFNRRELGEAAQAFQKAVEINPYYAEAHYNLGSLLEEKGRLDEASTHYRRALENRPGHRLANFRLGRILLHQNKFEEAIDHFRRTLEPQDDDTPRYLYALAIAHARSTNYREALDYAHRAHQQASDLGQTELVESIEKDLRLIEQAAER